MHIPNIARSTKARLQACCDVSAEALELCRTQFGVERLYNDYMDAIASPEVDAICLATTEKLRYPVIEAAARAGKPLYVEKPLARELEEMYRIQRLVNEAGIPLCVGHNRRCSPAMIEARRVFRRHMGGPNACAWRWNREGDRRPALAEEGRASMVVRINDDWHSWKAWVFDREQAPHGPLLFEMTHFTDLCNWFLDAKPVEVSAIESGMLNHSVTIAYESGEMATIVMCANGTFGYPKELYEMMGNGGIVVVDHMVEVRTAGVAGAPPRTTYAMLNDKHPEVGDEGGISGWLAKKRAACQEAASKVDPMLQFTAEPDKGHAHAIDAFVDEIRGGPRVCGVDEAVLATRVAFAAVKSAQDRRIVRLDEV